MVEAANRLQQAPATSHAQRLAQCQASAIRVLALRTLPRNPSRFHIAERRLISHLVRDEGVAGSNPATPTSFLPS
jgi:hypothetical protein